MTRIAIFSVLAALAAAGACTDAGVVGGECREGLTACNGKCVVGGCGGQGGSDGGIDASQDSGVDGDAGADAIVGDVTHADRDGADDDAADGTSVDAPPGDAGDAGCVPPFNTPQQCGDCFTQCPASAPICALEDGGYACTPFCTPPLVQCGSECVDLNSDPDHCGTCFNKCPSGICQGGQCVGATTGHIVLACMNYEQSFQNTPQTVLLGNAVFLTFKDPVRILAFDQYSAQNVENKVNQTIGWAASAKGRTFNITYAANSAQVVSDLNVIDYEVFLVYEQQNAPPGTLGTLGNSWFATLDPFVKAGGVVIVLNGGQGVAEMSELVANAGLLPVTGETSAALSTFHNNAPADAIGVNVISPFLALNDSCTWNTTATPGLKTIFVISDSATPGSGDPVVVHRVP